jgi:hypothetical protein
MGTLSNDPEELAESRFSIWDICFDKEKETLLPTQVEEDKFATAKPSSTRSPSIAGVAVAARNKGGREGERERKNPASSSRGDAELIALMWKWDTECVAASFRMGEFSGFWGEETRMLLG